MEWYLEFGDLIRVIFNIENSMDLQFLPYFIFYWNEARSGRKRTNLHGL